MNRGVNLTFLAIQVAVSATAVEAASPPDYSREPLAADSVSEAGCEEIICQAGFLHENEPDCGAFDDGNDTVNGGCSSPSFLFSPMTCGETYCGTTGASNVAPFDKDNDYYRFVLTATTNIQAVFRSDSSFNGPSLSLASIVNGVTCDFLDFDSSTLCGELTLSACLTPGTYALNVRPLGTATNGCGAAYTLELTCDECRGACCNDTTGICTEDATPEECDALAGEWLEGSVCSAMACPAVGACCDPATGFCEDDTGLTTCATAGGDWSREIPCCLLDCTDPGDTFPAKGVTLLSHLPVEEFPGVPGAANDIWHYLSPGGEEYAIIGFSTGTAFVRVSDPVNPVIVDFIDGFVDQRWRDMATFGEYAFVVSDGNGVGMQVIDLADIDNGNISPIAPVTQFGFATAHNVFVNPQSGHAYAVGANLASGGIVVIDVNVPESPQIVASWNETYVHDVFVKSYQTGPHAGREIAFAFAAEEGLVVVDVTDKLNLFTVSSFQYPNLTYCHQGWLSEDGRLLFINDELDELENPDVTTSTTYVVNVEDLANPFLAGTFTNGKCATDHNIMVRGHFVFEANNSSGLRVFDSCNPSDVREIGFFDTHPEHNLVGILPGAWGVDTQLPSGIVLVSDRQHGLFVLDVSEALTSSDPDGDGVSDFCDPCPNDNPDDTDGDGVCDSSDICPNGDDGVDSDDDGVPDDCDLCPGGDDGLDADADSVPDACDRCPGADDAIDTDGDGLPDECDICDNRFPETCTFVSPMMAPAPHDILKNRYVSIDPRGKGAVNSGVGFDIQVRLTATQVNGVTAVGSIWWAHSPDEDCISIVGWSQPTTTPNWDACPTVHLTGCPIIPTSNYDVYLVVGGLPSVPSLSVATQAKPGVKWFGDAVGHFNGTEWTAPNGEANIDDAVAAIKTFQNSTGLNATHVSVTDVHPNHNGEQINKVVNFGDVFELILSFQGNEYPGTQIELCPDP